ncbi:aspartate-semialdehyde dehydrogenase [Providencia stuartii]|nr:MULTISPECIES: aspartate-semialdehyde dehydrogenase [Providencia]MDK7736089.1 aspartate-semialdehyde dehydrogenase [Providencia stuartii]MDN0007997.1 aspartate-semialdehyde dehydrogenase [Providencia stuartii]MDN0012082.1 aspartate-semialdehyde dehydrogenase [Providencia stuartii]MDN7225085.1 aspartate-semialdehyde dehydrogenase [Providencia stuartii]MDQ5990431.1 aspartate-semialdehyde dehydrogenase [Providencia stuartii]
MTEGWNIALLGATGAVGEAILALLQEREFPVGELHLLASERSAGESLRFNNKSYQVQDATDFDWSQAQIAFFAAGEEASLYYAERAAQEGCIVIDTSGVFALEPDVPLVVPSVNPHVLADYRNRNIIALADSYVSQLLSATKPLIEAAGIGRITLTNMLSVSSYGKAAVDELAGQSARLLNGIPAEEGRFSKQLAFNMLPMLADMEGSVQQERRLVEQVRKVLQDDGLPVAVSFIQSPVFYGNAQVVYLETLRPVGVEEARDELERFDDIQVSEEGDYPTQVTEASGNDRLSIGCIRNDYGIPEILQFWSVADNVRFGGALMAVETAEKLAQELFYWCQSQQSCLALR